MGLFSMFPFPRSLAVQRNVLKYLPGKRIAKSSPTAGTDSARRWLLSVHDMATSRQPND
jgi:hypothetical protein